MNHRPFRELTKDWSPERPAGNEARVEKRLAELDRHEGERTRDERTSHAATEELRPVSATDALTWASDSESPGRASCRAPGNPGSSFGRGT